MQGQIDIKNLSDLYSKALLKDDGQAKQELNAQFFDVFQDLEEAYKFKQDYEKARIYDPEANIRICPNCEQPLLWTFAFSGAERYCLNCGYTAGMLDGSGVVPATPELFFRYVLINAIWKVIYSDIGYMPEVRFQRSDCDQCRSLPEGDYQGHWGHVTEEEKQFHEIGKRYMIMVRGLFENFLVDNPETEKGKEVIADVDPVRRAGDAS